MLSLSLPLANGDAEAADADGFAPNAFIRIGSDGQIVLTMPYVEMGQGTYTVHPDADRRRAGGGPETGAAGACSAQRKALRQPRCWRRAGNRQLERDTRGVAAAAPGRCDRANHAGVGGGKALECRSGVLPRAKRRGASRADGATPQIWRACRRRRPHAGPRKRGAQATGGFQAHRHAGQAPGHAGEGQRNGRLWHRRSAAGREDRDPCAIARLRRSREERGRCGGQGRQGRAPDRAARRRRRRRGRPYGRCEERAGGPGDRMGRRSARQAQHGRDRGRARKGDAQCRARLRRTSAMSTRPWRAPSPRSRRPTRFRSSRTRRWSR